MSTMIVNKFDIDILVTAYSTLHKHGRPLLNLRRIGRELIAENVKSFEASYRVHGRPKGHDMRDAMARGLAFARRYEFTRRKAWPAAVAKIAQFYDYQACEHDGYATSPAKAIVDALMARYPETPESEAMPWGISGAADLMKAGCTARVDKSGKLH